MCDCNKQQAPERKPHVHADVIKEWADGVAIQYYNTVRGGWEDIEKSIPSFNISTEYRVKPEPKPQTDLEKYGVEVGDVWNTKHNGTIAVRHVAGSAIRSLNLSYFSEVEMVTLLYRRGVINNL